MPRSLKNGGNGQLQCAFAEIPPPDGMVKPNLDRQQASQAMPGLQPLVTAFAMGFMVTCALWHTPAANDRPHMPTAASLEATAMKFVAEPPACVQMLSSCIVATSRSLRAGI